MDNRTKLQKAIELLKEVCNTWDEDEVIEYGCIEELPQIVEEIEVIELKKDYKEQI